MDNCWRENKNTPVLAYLKWLVERGVFKRIEMSFLPVGHTHNECDQVASRYSIACRHTDILCHSDLMEVLRHSFYPEPVIEHIDVVADWIGYINPERSDHWGPSARVHRAEGCSVPLHFLIKKEPQGRVCIRTKETHREPNWSDPRCLWRRAGATASGFSLSDIPLSPVVEFTEEVLEKIEKALESCYERMHHRPDAIAECRRHFETLKSPVARPLHWEHGGMFLSEINPPRPEPISADSLHRAVQERQGGQDGLVMPNARAPCHINPSAPGRERDLQVDRARFVRLLYG